MVGLLGSLGSVEDLRCFQIEKDRFASFSGSRDLILKGSCVSPTASIYVVQFPRGSSPSQVTQRIRDVSYDLTVAEGATGWWLGNPKPIARLKCRVSKMGFLLGLHFSKRPMVLSCVGSLKESVPSIPSKH